MGGAPSTFFNQLNWPQSNMTRSTYVLPPMNIDPNYITVTGFAEGAYYASNLAIINSATITGGGFRAGGPYDGYNTCNGRNPANRCDDKWVEKRVEDL